jgi:hypothetical protein
MTLTAPNLKQLKTNATQNAGVALAPILFKNSH